MLGIVRLVVALLGKLALLQLAVSTILERRRIIRELVQRSEVPTRSHSHPVDRIDENSSAPEGQEILLPSGRWQVRIVDGAWGGVTVFLVDPEEPRNRITVTSEKRVHEDNFLALLNNVSARSWLHDGEVWHITLSERIAHAYPDDQDLARASPPLSWMQLDSSSSPQELPWFGLGHLRNDELVQWFRAQQEQRLRQPGA